MNLLFLTQENLDNEAVTALQGTYKIIYSLIHYMAEGKL
jgi:hypothetical protein